MPDDPSRATSADAPSPARTYDYLLGGTNDYLADRDAAEAGMTYG
jgi:hypothetical protein